MTFTPNPLPLVPANVRLSNPFDLVVVDDQVYVTDGLFFGGPGLLLRFQTPMALDEKTNTLYVTELAARCRDPGDSVGGRRGKGRRCPS